jgi:Phenazine biosynthesis-like protein
MVERETTLTPRNKDRIEEHTLQESTGAQSRSTFVSEGSSLCPRCDPRRQRLEPSLTLHLEQANRHAMQINIYHVDAFTNRLFGGNPAAVCPLNRWISVTTMQEIATENKSLRDCLLRPQA